MNTITYTCTNDTYCPNGDTYDSVEDFQRMCVAAYGERANLVQHGDDWIDADTREDVLVPAAPTFPEWVAVSVDADDDCDVEGAVTVHLRGHCDASALVVRDTINGGWTVYGDCRSMWLGGDSGEIDAVCDRWPDEGADLVMDLIEAAEWAPQLDAIS